MSDFRSVKTGDVVTRLLGGTVPMRLRVTSVDDERIWCSAWCFDRETGAEIDEYLRWGPRYGYTGSILSANDEAAV